MCFRAGSTRTPTSSRAASGLRRIRRRLWARTRAAGSTNPSLRRRRPRRTSAARCDGPRRGHVTQRSALLTPLCLSSQMLFQFPASESQPPSFFVGGPMVIDNLADSCQQAPPPAPLTPAPPPSTPACIAGPSFAPQGSETSFDCSHCGKSLRSRKNYSKHMFIHSGTPHVLHQHRSQTYDN